MFVALMLLALSGCATKPIPQEELSKYKSVGELIADNKSLMTPSVSLETPFMGTPIIKTGPGYHPQSKVEAPIQTLRIYCDSISKGDFKKLIPDILYKGAFDNFRAFGGLYACNQEEMPLWYAELYTKNVSKSSLSLAVREVDQKSAHRALRRHGIEVAKQEKAEKAWRNSPRVKRFMAEAEMSKYPGLTVCSPDNFIGRVRSVRGDEIFVQVIGVARTPVIRTKIPDLQFFSGESFEYYFMETEATMWSKSKDWAACRI